MNHVGSYDDPHTCYLCRRTIATAPAECDAYPAASRTAPSGFFIDHRCWKCGDGEKLCAQDRPGLCEYPRARND